MQLVTSAATVVEVVVCVCVSVSVGVCDYVRSVCECEYECRSVCDVSVCVSEFECE